MSISNFVLITGHRKSGTTVFSKLFENHPDIYIYPVDISILYAYFPNFVSNHVGESDKLRERLSLIIHKSLLGVSNDIGLTSTDISSFAELVLSRLQSEYLANRGKVINCLASSWVDFFYSSSYSRPFVFKETSQSLFFEGLAKDLTGLKMISLIRDPRDNFAALKAGVIKYYSSLGEGLNETLASMLFRSRLDLQSAKHNSTFFPKDFMAVRFEDLVKDTKSIMQSISAFLGIQYHQSLTKPTAIGGKEYTGNSFDNIKFDGLSNQNIGKWPERISPNEAAIIEFWMGEIMEYWGYDLHFSPDVSHTSFAEFYPWLNTNYFYKDSFK